MSDDAFRCALLLCLVWTISRTIKAAVFLRRREPYTISQWEGGLLLKGRTLTQLGTQVRVVAGTLVAVSLALIMSRHVPIRPIACVMMAVLGVAVISDLVLSTKKDSSEQPK
jgi:hypothetical protein